MTETVYDLHEREALQLYHRHPVDPAVDRLGRCDLLFLNTGGGLNLAAPAPVEALTIERTVLKPGQIEVLVRNSSPEDLTDRPGDRQRCRLAVHHLARPPPSLACRMPGSASTIPGITAKPTPSAFSPPMPSPSTCEIPVAFETPQPDSRHFLELHPDWHLCGCDPGLPGLVLVSRPAPAWPQVDDLFAGHHCRAAGLLRPGYPGGSAGTGQPWCRAHSRESGWSGLASWGHSSCSMPSPNARSPSGAMRPPADGAGHHDCRRHWAA